MYDFPSSVPRLADRVCSWIPIAAAGISALGSIAGGLLSNSAAKDRAEEQMEFQREMSNTAYQRAVTDMRAAGINPILAAKVGGASTPTGAMGTTVDFSNAIPSAVNTGMAAARMEADLDKIKADTSLAEAQANKANVEAQVAAGKGPHEIDTAEETTSNVAAQTNLLREQAGVAQATAHRLARLTEPERNKLVEEAIKLFHEGQSAKSIAVQNQMLENYLQSDAGEWMRKLGFVGKDIGPIVQGIFDIVKIWKLGSNR